MRYARKICDKLNGHPVELGKRGSRIIRVFSSQCTFDIARLVGRSVVEDLQNRDFTINAMACETATGRLIDPLDGRRDLNAGRVRMVSENIFSNDAVRLIRAFRIAADLHFKIEEQTMQVIERDSPLIGQTAAERVRDEMLKLLECPRAFGCLDKMTTAGLLPGILKRAGAWGSQMGPQPESEKRIRHALKAIYDLENRIHSYPPALCEVRPSIPVALFKWSVLLYAVLAQAPDPGAEKFLVGSIGYRSELPPQAERICRTLRFSNRARRRVAAMLGSLDELFQIFRSNALRPNVPYRQIIRFFQSCGETTPDVLLAAATIQKSGHPAAPGPSGAFDRFAVDIMGKYAADYLPRARRASPVNGRDLMRAFNLPPSPLIGAALRYVEQERLRRKEMPREAAIEAARKFLKKTQRG
jgi:tRNA nucleotidyltransferase/poly(A) polymerase